MGVQFEIDADGLLSVLARDIATGRDTKVKMQSAVEVSDEAVEKMLSDSLEHAFDDMDERAFAEACLKADEMLPAVETALRRLGDEVAPHEREKISGLVRQVSEARGMRFAFKSEDGIERAWIRLPSRWPRGSSKESCKAGCRQGSARQKGKGPVRAVIGVPWKDSLSSPSFALWCPARRGR